MGWTFPWGSSFGSGFNFDFGVWFTEEQQREAGRRIQLPARGAVGTRAVPIAVGVVVAIAGSLQLTAWKARHLACCRDAPGRARTLAADADKAWRHGVRLGLHCSHCCAGLMVILLVIGFAGAGFPPRTIDTRTAPLRVWAVTRYTR